MELTKQKLEKGQQPAAKADRERELRARLGVPDEARRVLIFAETSHWDPNWLFTSEQYYERRIQSVLDEVMEALDADPRRIFSVESIFFLRLYWERNPEQRGRIQALVNSGRLRLSGSGITTPDVVLTDTEAILRDYLLGQEWLRNRGMNAEPNIAYLPDDFGYTPALPSILQALNVKMAGITRIDGMYFIGSDYRPRSAFPRPGSSAWKLTKELKTLDFVWRAPDGAEVLCHWNAFTYFQGDLLGHLGIIRWMGRVYGFQWRNENHVSRQIHRFARALEPLAPTPYIFCPIGCDFNGPLPNLPELLHRYNQHSYPATGLYVVNAGLDDYLELVDTHRDELPVVDFDPNPYWMGFYASRPLAKRMCNRTSRKLALAERLDTHIRVDAEFDADQHSRIPRGSSFGEQMAEAWDLLAISNHHDFITGTSPDAVWNAEQLPWLERADELSDALLEDVQKRVVVPPRPFPTPPPTWNLRKGRLEISTSHYRIVLEEERGGCFTSYKAPEGAELLTGPGNDLVAYRGSGGLWRMGHEYLGGRFKEKKRSSDSPASIEAREVDGVLEVKVTSKLGGTPFLRYLWFRGDSPMIRMAVEGAARNGITVTCRFPTRLRSETLTMDVPGGVLERPRCKLYDPTFWPARSFVHVRESGEQSDGFAAFLGGPVAPSLGADGELEWMAFRNAPRERAWIFVPLLSHPATGRTAEVQRFTYGVWHTPPGDWRAHDLISAARQVLHRTWSQPTAPDLDDYAASLLYCDPPEVAVSAFKKASRGPGTIARLTGHGHSGGTVRLVCSAQPIRRAVLCDALERDLHELEVREGAVILIPPTNLFSVRLLFA